MVNIDRFAVAGGAGEFASAKAVPQYPPDLELEPVELSVGLRLELEQRTLELDVVHVFAVRREGGRRIRLDGVGFDAIQVEHPDGGAPPLWSYDGQGLDLCFPAGALPGDLAAVRVRYRVVEPVAGVYFSFPTAEQPDAPRFAATDHETERARHWLLCVDHPSARPRMSFALRAPVEYLALANGREEALEDHGDGTRTTRWRLDAPCPSYLVCFAIGPFAVCEEEPYTSRFDADGGAGQRVPIAYFGPEGTDPERLRASFGRTAQFLAWFEEFLGRPYPYPKYFQFALPGIGGAMENISLVSWDGVFLLDEGRQGEWTWLVDLINVHEMAHTWFGDHVVCRDFRDSWLKESFATFMEAVWTRDVYGRDEGDWIAWNQAQAYFAEARDSYRRPIVTRRFESSWQLFDRHLYPGGARRLAALEAELSPPTFWRGVRLYLDRFAGSGVETDDLRRALEEVSGRSLARYFEEWFQSPGHPELKVSFRWDGEQRRGVFVLEQTQRSGAFGFGLTLAWRTEGVWDQRRVEVRSARQEVWLAMDAQPELVRVNPRGEALVELDFDPGEERLLRQLRESEEARGRYEAAWLLATCPSPKRARAVGAALAVEPFWAARVEMAGALARMGSSSAIEELAGAVRRESEPRAMEPLFRQMLALSHPSLRAAVVERLEAQGGALALPPRARAAATELLGNQRDGTHLELLVREAQTPAASMEPQSAALRALGATRDPMALEPLLAALAPSFRRADARPAAATGLGELARVLERAPRERAVDALLAALLDRDRLVALAAARALGRAREPRAIGALSAFGAGLCTQERVAVAKVVDGLKEQERPVAERQWERLQADLRRLEERLASLEARGEGISKGDVAP